MIQTEQQILESIRALTPERRERVIKAALSENDKRTWKSGTDDEIAARYTRFQKAQQWIHSHKEEFDGQFVLLDGDVLLGHGIDPKELYDLARERGIKSPYVTRIKALDLPFGGW